MSGAATPSATVGMVFECGPQGADKQVGEYLAKHIRPDIGIWPGTLDNKANLLRDADKVDAVRVLQAAPVVPATVTQVDQFCAVRIQVAYLRHTALIP